VPATTRIVVPINISFVCRRRRSHIRGHVPYQFWRRSSITGKPRPPATISAPTVRITTGSPWAPTRLSSNGERPALQNAETEWNSAYQAAVHGGKVNSQRTSSTANPSPSMRNTKRNSRRTRRVRSGSSVGPRVSAAAARDRSPAPPPRRKVM